MAVLRERLPMRRASQGASQVVVHGTAVIIKPIINYVPVGAAGNILCEIQEALEKGPR